MTRIQIPNIVCAGLNDECLYFPVDRTEQCMHCKAWLTVRPETPVEIPKICAKCCKKKYPVGESQSKSVKKEVIARPTGTLKQDATPPPIYVKVEPDKPAPVSVDLKHELALLQLEARLLGKRQ